MTAAMRDASVRKCPDCAAAVGEPCRWPDGSIRKTPHLTRYTLAAPNHTPEPPKVAPRATQPPGIDMPVERDLSEPKYPHPMEDQ